jgi:hypothetical protein
MPETKEKLASEAQAETARWEQETLQKVLDKTPKRKI